MARPPVWYEYNSQIKNGANFKTIILKFMLQALHNMKFSV
jgi:hypothetical protein